MVVVGDGDVERDDSEARAGGDVVDMVDVLPFVAVVIDGLDQDGPRLRPVAGVEDDSGGADAQVVLGPDGDGDGTGRAVAQGDGVGVVAAALGDGRVAVGLRDAHRRGVLVGDVNG